MSDKENILQALYGAVDQVNAELNGDQKLDKSPETVLFGVGSSLDSLGLVNFIVAAEQIIDDKMGAAISIADERAMSQKNSPFRTIQTLADYVEILVKEKTGD